MALQHNRRRRQPTGSTTPGVALSSARSSAPSLSSAGETARGTGILPPTADLSMVGFSLGHPSYTRECRHRAPQPRMANLNGLQTHAACPW